MRRMTTEKEQMGMSQATRELIEKLDRDHWLSDEELDVPAAEIRYEKPEGLPEGLKLIQASDAHDLATLAGGGFPLPLDRADFAGLKKYVTGKEI